MKNDQTVDPTFPRHTGPIGKLIRHVSVKDVTIVNHISTAFNVAYTNWANDLAAATLYGRPFLYDYKEPDATIRHLNAAYGARRTRRLFFSKFAVDPGMQHFLVQFARVMPPDSVSRSLILSGLSTVKVAPQPIFDRIRDLYPQNH